MTISSNSSSSFIFRFVILALLVVAFSPNFIESINQVSLNDYSRPEQIVFEFSIIHPFNDYILLLAINPSSGTTLTEYIIVKLYLTNSSSTFNTSSSSSSSNNNNNNNQFNNNQFKIPENLENLINTKVNSKYSVHVFKNYQQLAPILSLNLDVSGENLFLTTTMMQLVKINLETMQIGAIQNNNSQSSSLNSAFFCNGYIYLVPQTSTIPGILMNQYNATTLELVNSLPSQTQPQITSSLLDCSGGSAYIMINKLTTAYIYKVNLLNISSVVASPLYPSSFDTCSYFWQGDKDYLYAFLTKMAYQPSKFLVQIETKGLTIQNVFSFPTKVNSFSCEANQVHDYVLVYTNKYGIQIFFPSPLLNNTVLETNMFWNSRSNNEVMTMASNAKYNDTSFLLSCTYDQIDLTPITDTSTCNIILLKGSNSTFSLIGQQHQQQQQQHILTYLHQPTTTTLPSNLSLELFFSFNSPTYNMIDLVYTQSSSKLKQFISFASTFTGVSYIDVIRVNATTDSTQYISNVMCVQVGLVLPFSSFQVKENLVYVFFGSQLSLNTQGSLLSALIVDFYDSSMALYTSRLRVNSLQVIQNNYNGNHNYSRRSLSTSTSTSTSTSSYPSFSFFVTSITSQNFIHRAVVLIRHGFVFQEKIKVAGGQAQGLSIALDYTYNDYAIIYNKASTPTGSNLLFVSVNQSSTNTPSLSYTVNCNCTLMDAFLTEESNTTVMVMMLRSISAVVTATPDCWFKKLDMQTGNILFESAPTQFPFSIFPADGSGAFLDSYSAFAYFYLTTGVVFSVDYTTFQQVSYIPLPENAFTPLSRLDGSMNNAFVLQPQGVLVLNLDCIAGYYRPNPNKGCQKCHIGSFSPNSAFECSICQLGTIAPKNGSASCSPCPIGTSSSDGRSCAPCLDSTYAPDPKMSQCLPCPKDSVSSSDYSTCVCAYGYYDSATNSSSQQDYDGVATQSSSVSLECTPCPIGANCTNGLIYPLENYWSPHPNSSFVFPCPFTGACLGGLHSNCSEGYYGIACAGCTDGYSFYINSCSKCPPHFYQTIFLIVLFFLALLILLLIAYKAGVNVTFSALKILISYGQVISSISVTISTNQEALEKLLTLVTLSNVDILHAISLDCLFGREVSFYESYWVSVVSPLFIIFLIVVAHYSTKFITRTIKHIRFVNNQANQMIEEMERDQQRDKNLQYNLEDFAPRSNDESVGSSFILNDDEIEEINNNIRELEKVLKLESSAKKKVEDDETTEALLEDNLLDPTRTTKSILALKQRLLFERIRRKKLLKHPNRDALWRDILLVFLLTYSAVCQTVLSLYSCVEINGQYYLQYDLNTLCSGFDWQMHAYIGVIFVILYPVGVPLLFWILLYLWRRRRLISEEKVKERLSLLYAGYKDNCWYWECLELVRKLLLTSAVSITIRGGVIGVFNKNSINAVVCVLALFLQYHFKPFLDNADNWLQFNSLAMIYFIYFYLLVSNNEPADSISIQTLGTIDSIILLILAGIVATHGIILAVMYGKKLMPEIKSFLLNNPLVLRFLPQNKRNQWIKHQKLHYNNRITSIIDRKLQRQEEEKQTQKQQQLGQSYNSNSSKDDTNSGAFSSFIVDNNNNNNIDDTFNLTITLSSHRQQQQNNQNSTHEE
ncbi:hypothetical protein DFA_02768 [Cavenderia fasciculata]|uniref:Tyrosine-protein kinase ephrin type A/B receptor-like domain-containing protein n=1 Tax=Cavenderia fasciculata TaxID=261658 RepID=F4PI91_CACFS|nr:uncharacterized protein DFA_02768 [Cavenderia fasciculata]EGG24525.1 hypothetical protein DFA_02768 [Cavenderia fasciculata]|eukprot:XP_004362376.1 hypothetical protein DFA_02768 [Cavenderia fasciculata]